MFNILLLLVIVIVLQLLYLISCDEKFYIDTNAEEIPGLNTLNMKKLMVLDITTSNKYLANTIDDIYVTFIGEFASSGPHNIGSFLNRGTLVNKTVYLNRVIGRLQNVLFEKKGVDAWLLSSLSCTIDGVKYEMDIKQQWLALFDQVTAELYDNNGYEPNAAEKLTELQASATLTFPVKKVIKLFTTIGSISDVY